MRLVDFRRVSTMEQAGDDRFGLERQAVSNRATAQRLNAVLLAPPIVVTDVCRSDFISTPEWATIREVIRAPDVHIAVDASDRFIADYGGIEILAECQRTGTRIYDTLGVLDPGQFEGKLLGVIKSVMAANELLTIKQRVQGAKEARRREGIFPSTDSALPTGIMYLRTKGQRRGKWTYTSEIERVRRVYRLFTEEGLRNYAEIGRRTGFSPQTARNILRNPIYMGLWIVDEKREAGPTPIRANGRRKDRRKIKRAPQDVIQHRVFRVPGSAIDPNDPSEEAIVDEAVWQSIQGAMDAKRAGYFRRRDPKSGDRFVYGGCLWCAVCGAPVWTKTKAKHGRALGPTDHYVCKSGQVANGKPCGTRYLHLQTVHASLDNLFASVLSERAVAKALFDSAMGEQYGGLQDQAKEARAALARLESKQARLLDLYVDGVYSRAELDARRLKLGEQIERTRRELAMVEVRLVGVGSPSANSLLEDALVSLREYEFWSPSQKREFLRRFFPRVDVSKRGVERIHVALPSTLLSETLEGGFDPSGGLVLRIERAWNDLIPPTRLTDFGLPERRLYTSGAVAAVLDMSRSAFNDRVRKNDFPSASGRVHGKPAWSLEEVRDILARHAAARIAVPLGSAAQDGVYLG